MRRRRHCQAKCPVKDHTADQWMVRSVLGERFGPTPSFYSGATFHPENGSDWPRVIPLVWHRRAVPEQLEKRASHLVKMR